MLQELSQLKRDAETGVEGNLEVELDFSEVAKKKILMLYKSHIPDYEANLSNGLIKISNKSGQTAYLPFNWFSRIKHCRAFIEALNCYAIYVEKLKLVLDEPVMKSLPKVDWEGTLNSNDVSKIYNFINDQFDSDEDRSKFSKFLDGRVWLNSNGVSLSGKKLDRQSSDYIASCITNICKLINDTAGKLEHFIRLYIKNSEVRDIVNNQPVSTLIDDCHNISTIAVGRNIIYYGAPGTGKSYRVKAEVGNQSVIRTVFHPDTQYSDFIGTLKPKTIIDSANNTRISYEFRPGPFTLGIIKAFNTQEPVFLVIEELNRAPAAAVFGELFQLLDRKSDGSSEYEIDVSDPDMLSYINSKLVTPIKTIYLPANLSIIATMNNSDQAVMPMDAAFKRRWNFEYVPIDYTLSSEGSLIIPINNSEPCRISWRSFSEIINNQLKILKVPEDRLLGHRFLSSDELSNEVNARNALCGKLFVYLWDDVLRHGQREVIFNTEQCNTFGELAALFLKNKSVFTEELEGLFITASESYSGLHGATVKHEE